MKKKYPAKPAGVLANPRRKRKAKKGVQQIYDRPPIPKRGATSIRAIHAAVGEALSAWEGLEMEYAGLFDILFGDRPPNSRRAQSIWSGDGVKHQT